MSKLKNNQSGISSIVSLIIFLLVVIVILLGFAINKNHHDSSKTTTVTNKTAKSISKPVAVTTTTPSSTGTATTSGSSGKSNSSSESSSSNTNNNDGLYIGTYYDGTQNPEYKLTIENGSGGNINGIMDYIAGNGTQSQIFSYTASNFKQGGTLNTAPAMSQPVIMERIYSSVILVNCQKYLKYIEAGTSCTFNPSM